MLAKRKINDAMAVLVGKDIVLPAPAKKALEYLDKHQNNSYYYQFEYGVVKKDGDIYVSPNKACHAQMHSMPKDCTAIWSKFPKPGHGYHGDKVKITEQTLKFNDWLLHRSPWAQVFVPTTTEFATKKGFVIADLNQAANLIVNALIATRIPSEHYWEVARWNDLVDAGVHENMAFILTVSFGREGVKLSGGIGHHPLDPNELTMEAVEAFMNGTPKGCNHPYVKNQDYKPCNKVWGGNIKGDFNYQGNPYGCYIEKQYPIKKEAGARMFRVSDDAYMKYPLARLVEIGITETGRILKDARPKLEEQHAAEAKPKRVPRKRKAA